MFPDITPESNLRTWLGKVAVRAGVELWEKPWVNMRASAATDAADKFPGHVCEAWFGHSEAIANKHYRQVKEDHFQKAVSTEDSPPNRAASTAIPVVAESQPADRTTPYRKGAEGGRKASEKSVANSGARKDEKAAQNPARYPILPDRMESQETQKAFDNKGLERFCKTRCNPSGLRQYPLGESNPCSRTENPMSWATRRRGPHALFLIDLAVGETHHWERLRMTQMPQFHAGWHHFKPVRTITFTIRSISCQPSSRNCSSNQSPHSRAVLGPRRERFFFTAASTIFRIGSLVSLLRIGQS